MKKKEEGLGEALSFSKTVLFGLLIFLNNKRWPSLPAVGLGEVGRS